MNELANFCTGTSCTFNGTVIDDLTSCYLQCPDDFNHTKYDEPSFKINHAGGYEGLGYRTAAMTVKHYDGTIEYNSHNLYGLAEAIATNKAMTMVRNKRPFVLSRSTFIGSGGYTAHWTGDNGASFNDLAYSIVTVLNSGLYGIPMIGADICGFNDETTEDTCNRWIQTGAFHPFSRAHNSYNNQPKELYLWKSVTISAQKALGLRYRLLPFFYTLNYEAHKKGYPIVRPLFFAFPLDPNTLDVSYQFLIGNNILVSPVVTANTTSIEAYFPKGTWYNMFDWSKVVSKGENFTLAAPWDTINVHVREGSIITLQDSALTSLEVRKSPFTLVVAFPSDSLLSSASGYIFLDNGDEIVMELDKGKSSLVTFKADFEGGSGLLKSKVKYGDYALKEGWIVDNVILLGVKVIPTSFHLNEELIDPKVELLGDSGLFISSLGHLLGEPFELQWSL
jgi:alpha-D-xyloside xylohydrolase